MIQEHKLIWLFPILMLLITPFHLPYSYYTFLRIIVTACSSYLVYIEYMRSNALSFPVVLFIVIAIIFNPVIPFYFSKLIWIGIDICTALIFGYYVFIFHKQS